MSFKLKRHSFGCALLLVAHLAYAESSGKDVVSPQMPEMTNLLVEAQADRPAPTVSLPIQFARNSHTLNEQGKTLLVHIARELMSAPFEAIYFDIEGHTDVSGGYEVNMALSQNRADAVRDFLRYQGVPSSRMTAKGLGYSQLIEGLPMNSAEHRRVLVRRVYK